MEVPGQADKPRIVRFLERHKAVVLLIIVVLGFCLRFRGLDRVGFNEDEINKLDAARGYLRGDFSLNREHPMLMKSLIAATYLSPPTHNYVSGAKRVGMLVFDPEGEYFFPDNQGRPGLCDVPHLRDQIAVFTERQPPSTQHHLWRPDRGCHLPDC